MQAFTYSLKDPHCTRNVSIAFSVLDWDIMSPPDLAGTCKFDVSAILKECMEQQREIVLEKQWIPLMMEKTSLFDRLRGSGQAVWAPVKGFNGKVSSTSERLGLSAWFRPSSSGMLCSIGSGDVGETLKLSAHDRLFIPFVSGRFIPGRYVTSLSGIPTELFLRKWLTSRTHLLCSSSREC